MTLLEQWRGSAYNENMTQEQYNQFWNHYFVIEKGFYESLLADNEVVTGTIPQLLKTSIECQASSVVTSLLKSLFPFFSMVHP